VIEMGDGILGGYSVESVFDDQELRAPSAAIIFCGVGLCGRWAALNCFAGAASRLIWWLVQ